MKKTERFELNRRFVESAAVLGLPLGFKWCVVIYVSFVTVNQMYGDVNQSQYGQRWF